MSTDLLNENDSIKRNEDCIREEAILKSPLCSNHDEFTTDAKIGLKAIKENSPNEIIVGHLNIFKACVRNFLKIYYISNLIT